MNKSNIWLIGILVILMTACRSDPYGSARGIPIVTQVGQGLAVLGNGVTDLTTFAPPSPKTNLVNLTKEQETELLKDSERLPREFLELPTRSIGVGFGFYPYYAPPPTMAPPGIWSGGSPYGSPISPHNVKILQDAERVARGKINWFLNPNIRDVAIAAPGGVIMINPIAMQNMPEITQLFVVLHEVGHHVLGHASPTGMWTGSQAPWLLPQNELAADCFAVKKMKEVFAIPPVTINLMARQFFWGNPGDATHPPGIIRVENIRRCIGD